MTAKLPFRSLVRVSLINVGLMAVATFFWRRLETAAAIMKHDGVTAPQRNGELDGDRGFRIAMTCFFSGSFSLL